MNVLIPTWTSPLLAHGPVGNVFATSMGACGEALPTHSPDLYLGCVASNPLGSGGGQAADPAPIVGAAITPPAGVPPESIHEVLIRPIPGGVEILLSGKPLCQAMVSVLVSGGEFAQGSQSAQTDEQEVRLQELIKILESENPSSRRLAAMQLGEIGGLRASVALLEVLGRRAARGLRLSVVDALGNIPDPTVVWHLLQLVANDSNWDIRDHALSALVKIGSRNASLLVRYLHDESWDVRRKNREALIKIGTASVEPLLSSLDGKTNRIDPQVIEILGIIGDPRAVERLIHALDDPSADVREAAARALGKIGDPRAVAPLIRIRSGRKNEKVYAAAVWALCKIGDARAAEFLVGTLHHKNKTLRELASHALVKMGGDAVDDLIKRLDDDKICDSIATILGKIGDRRSIKPLRALIEGKKASPSQAHAITAALKALSQ